MRVYTAVFNRFDRVRSPSAINPSWTYTCICNPWMAVPHPWEVSVRDFHGSARKSSRYYKIMAHKSFPKDTVTVWHGGNVQLLTQPEELVKLLGNNDIAVIKHSGRESVYDEAKVCVESGLADHERVESQIARYQSEGFPGTRLSAAFLVVRRHTNKVAALNELWWSEVSNGSIRDQISFDYCCWKLGIKPAIIPGDIFRGVHFTRHAVHG